MADSMKANEMAWADYTMVTKDTEKSLYGVSYQRLKDSKEGVQWPCPTPNHPGTYKRYVRGMDPMFDHPGFKDRIPADAGQYFYMDAKGQGKANLFLRPYAGAAETPDAEYPFYLTTGRIVEQWHTGTMTNRVPEIARSFPNSYVEIHPSDAAKLGIKAGDMVEVASRRGSNILPVRIVELTLPGIVFIPMHDQKKERMVNFVCNDAVDGASKEPEYKIAAVKIKRVSGPVDVAEKYNVTDMNEKFV
jgi:nitrate reductase NapA